MTEIIKQPFKVLEIPLSKFSEEVIPHHQRALEQYKPHIVKLIAQSNVKEITQEVRQKKLVVKQLRDLIYELDTLRTQVQDVDLDKFDTKTLGLRKIINNLISNYTDLEKKCVNGVLKETETEPKRPFAGIAQIQIEEDINELRLREQQEVLNDVENIQRETEDIQEIFTQLKLMVDEQKEDVEHIEEEVEEAQTNINQGVKHIVKASRLKAAAYPVTGAFLGTMVGGPIGLVAGLKIGGLAAVACAIAGYAGGKLFKKGHENTTKVVLETNEVPVDGDGDKKDI